MGPDLNPALAPVGARREAPEVAGWRQFLLLATLTGFVGSIVGLERAVVPLLGARSFHLSSHLAILAFVISFGAAKAVANLVAGGLADRIGRRRVLLVGWALGLPEPLLIILAPTWSWVVAANLILGVQQGLCWTTLLSMMLDRSGTRSRGFVAGVNELFGYTGVAAAAIASGYLAAVYGLRPAPFLPSLALAALGLGLTARWVSETDGGSQSWRPGDLLSLLRRRRLIGASQAGLVANLLDALAWGLFPLYLAAHGLGVAQIGLVAGAYPLSWGLAQGLAGPLSDLVGRRAPIALGMAGQGLCVAAFLGVRGLPAWLAVAVLTGLFRALAYPTLIAAATDAAPDGRRASALGVYRFWRDSGFVAGGLLGGSLADAAGIPTAVLAGALLAGLSALATLRLLR